MDIVAYTGSVRSRIIPTKNRERLLALDGPEDQRNNMAFNGMSFAKLLVSTGDIEVAKTYRGYVIGTGITGNCHVDRQLGHPVGTCRIRRRCFYNRYHLRLTVGSSSRGEDEFLNAYRAHGFK